MGHDWLECVRPSLGVSRRQFPRVPAPGAFCVEVTDDTSRYVMLSDLSPSGLRLDRPFRSENRTRDRVQLEFELPNSDEIIWASGYVRFDRVWQASHGPLMHSTGIVLLRAATHHMKLLRDYAFENPVRRDRRAIAR